MSNSYQANHKTWDRVGNMTPDVEFSETERPAGEFKVADWLPVQRLDKHYEHFFVVSAGKIIAFDRMGRVVPAGLKTAFAIPAATHVLSYTASDVTEGVMNLVTGAPCTGAVDYDRTEITNALRAQGLLDATENAEDFINFPIGVAPYNYLKWCGGDGSNPAEYTQHNYNMQHQVAILCDYCVQVPLVPALASTLNLSGLAAISSSAIADFAPASAAWFDKTALGLTLRYAGKVNANTVALILPSFNCAKNTAITPWVLPVGFTREVSSLLELTTAGDYFVDLDVGVILMFETGGDAKAITTGSLVFYHYDAAPASVSTFACALGDLKPGDFVRADKNSNYVKAKVFAAGDIVTGTDTAPTDAELAAMLNQVMAAQSEIVGQVLELEGHPRDFLERVRTAFPFLGVMDRMPGTATEGMPLAITYAGASTKMVHILLTK